MNFIKKHTALGLIIFYIVGCIGILLPIHPQFILLTPLNLVYSMAMALLHHQQPDKRLWLGLLFCYAAGWLIELAGVQTGLLFGEYSYGGTLGFKVWGTPLLMGLNWAMLIYSVSAIAHRFFPQWHLLLRAALGATLMVFLDMWIEPIAVHFDFWAWKQTNNNAFWVAPLQNYLFWWAAAFVLIAIFQWLVKPFINKIAELLFWLQLLFFVVLYFGAL